MIVSWVDAEQKNEEKSGLITKITLGIYHYNKYIMMHTQLFPIVNE
jgi:hypothetical protein